MIDKFKEKFQTIINKNWFNIPVEEDDKHKKIVKFNIYILIGAGTIIIIFLFYLILSLSTNFSKLDDFEDYIDEYKEKEYPTKFSEINLGIKIKPSYNLENNILYMRHSSDPYKSIIEGSASLANSYDIKPTFFRTNQTRKVFPKFSFKSENVPLGDSLSLCLGANWGEIERGKHYEIMKPIQGFPQCSAANEKIIWNEDDSIYGIDIPAWKQTINEVDCNIKDCDDYCKNKYGGVFVKGVNKNVCYSYEKLDGICLVVKYDHLKDEYSYHGGCFPGNKVYKLVPANPGEEDNFYNVEIEIRELNDPITKAGELTDYEYNFGHFWRYISFLFKLILLAAIGFLGYVAYEIYKLKKEKKANNSGSQDKNLVDNEN